MDHDSGVLLTPDVVGKTLYSHSAARNGLLTRLFITEVGYTDTKYRTEEGKTGQFATGNQGKGGRNWEAIDLPTAAKAIREYWRLRIGEFENLRNLLYGHRASAESRILAAASEETPRP